MIGLLDSGVGGLSIYQEIVRRNPGTAVVYFADKENFPYGEKSDIELAIIVRKAIKTLIKYGANIVVLACNSATVSTVKKLRTEFEIPIIGIEPAVKQAGRVSRNGRIGVLATSRTTADHDSEVLAPDCSLCKVHHGSLVAMIENDYKGVTDGVLADAMGPFILADVDTIALGCTHYHFVKDRLELLYPNITFLAPTEAVVNHFEDVVRDKEIELGVGNDIFLVSADHLGFENSLHNLLGIENADIRKI